MIGILIMVFGGALLFAYVCYIVIGKPQNKLLAQYEEKWNNYFLSVKKNKENK